MAAVDKSPHQGHKKLYTHSSKPEIINSRPKYRVKYLQNEEPMMFGNIMYDRRVVRGNTYALPLLGHPDPIEVQRQQEIKWRRMAKARARKTCGHQSPRPVQGRQHIEVQTELYLQYISDRLEETDVGTQTNDMLDRPPTPLFTPATSGKDVETQIYEEDIFNFSLDVRPILEVMVGKTLEQSLIEILEEEELANLRQQQREFEEKRNAELVEMQRLEEQERRHAEEKKRLMKQQRWALQMERETADKIAARNFASSYLLDLVPDVFSCMRKNGYFFDQVLLEVEHDFLPFIIEETAIVVENKIVARTILDGIIREVCLARLDAFTVPDDGYVDFDLDGFVFDDEVDAEEDTIEKTHNKISQLDPIEIQREQETKARALANKKKPILSEPKRPTVEEPEDEYTYDGSC